MNCSTTNIENARLECKSTLNGLEYNGTVSEDEYGAECAPWSQTTYRSCKYTEAESNYCRNMNNDEYGPWCYVRDKHGDIYKSYCDFYIALIYRTTTQNVKELIEE